MNKLTIAALGLAVLVLGTGAVAAQADTPIDVPDPDPPVEGPTTDDPANDSQVNPAADVNGSADAETENERGANQAAKASGPPVDLPEQVPDHVAEIHETIRTFLDGDLEITLGDAISDITPADDGGTESSEADDEMSENGEMANADSEDGKTDDAESEESETDDDSDEETQEDG